MSDIVSAVRSRLPGRSSRRRAAVWASVYCEVCDVRRPMADGGRPAADGGDASESRPD